MPVYRTADGRIVEETTLVRSPGSRKNDPVGPSDGRSGSEIRRREVPTDYDAPTVVRRPGATSETTRATRVSDDEPTRLAGAVPAVRHKTGASAGPVAGWLVIVEGPGTGQDLRIGLGRNELGRSRENRIALPFGDARVSRRCHLWVNYDPRNRVFSVAPGTGTNLAYLNGTAIEERLLLTDGADIEVGKTRLRFVAFCGDSFAWPDD